MDQVREALSHLDEQIEARVQAIRGDRDWFPCKRGCDHCCRQLAHPPELSSAEWDRVEDAIAALPAPIQTEIEQKIAALLQQITQQTVSATVVCPYLNESEGACQIYEARPIACRTYGFFVARDHDQYCGLIEAEVEHRQGDAIVWGNAEAIRKDLKQISGAPISFEQHYSQKFL